MAYYDPFNFLNILLDGNLASTIGGDIPNFNDPVYNRRLEEADKLNGAVRYEAYARLDADLARDAAPLVAFGNGNSEDFFSARMGCQQTFGPDRLDLAALCIREHARCDDRRRLVVRLTIGLAKIPFGVVFIDSEKCDDQEPVRRRARPDACERRQVIRHRQLELSGGSSTLQNGLGAFLGCVLRSPSLAVFVF